MRKKCLHSSTKREGIIHCYSYIAYGFCVELQKKKNKQTLADAMSTYMLYYADLNDLFMLYQIYPYEYLRDGAFLLHCIRMYS